MSSDGWIGVDLDGTLAKYEDWIGPTHIGEPIKEMVDRVKEWISSGVSVRIFTARVACENEDIGEILAAIESWCAEHLGVVLPVTCKKDYQMIELWDDRCVQVIPNTGIAIRDLIDTEGF